MIDIKIRRRRYKIDEVIFNMEQKMNDLNKILREELIKAVILLILTLKTGYDLNEKLEELESFFDACEKKLIELETKEK